MDLSCLLGIHTLSGIEFGERTFWVSQYRAEQCCYCKFTLDGTTYIAVENPDDGYRSYMEELQVVDEKCEILLPNIQVLCIWRNNSSSFHNDEVLSFVDIQSAKEILAIGTEAIDDYYPYCVLDYSPENMHRNIEQ